MKKLFTVAMSTLLVAPTAVLADVVVYGQLHTSIDYTDTNTDVPTGVETVDKGNLGLSSNSSRLGFKGSEDLGGGLKGIWQIESGLSMDNGGGALATRNTYLGLAGDFGTVLMGRHDTPFKMLSRSLDPFIDTIADNRQLLGNEGVAGTANWELRPNNVLAYITPNFSGFNAVLAYVTGLDNAHYGLENAGGADNNKMTALSLNGTYTNGPIYVGAAYEVHNTKDAGVVGAEDPSAWRIGGSYDFGPAKVGGMWEKLSNTDITTLSDTNRTAWTLFGTYTFGMETLKLAYTQASKWKVGDVDFDETDASLFAVGIDHKFSKRTTGYAQYTALDNQSNSQYVLGGGGGYGDAVTPGVGKDPKAFSVGLIHKF